MAAKQCMIGTPVIAPDGSVSVPYVIGDYPVSGPSSTSTGYASVADLQDAMTHLEATLIDDAVFVLLAMAARLKADPTMSVPADFAGGSAVIDLTTPTQPISFS